MVLALKFRSLMHFAATILSTYVAGTSHELSHLTLTRILKVPLSQVFYFLHFTDKATVA